MSSAILSSASSASEISTSEIPIALVRTVHTHVSASHPGFVVGTPETVRAYFEEYVRTGADYMVLSFQWGSLSHAQAMRSIRLFREELMPRHGLADPFRFDAPAAAEIA